MKLLFVLGLCALLSLQLFAEETNEKDENSANEIPETKEDSKSSGNIIPNGTVSEQNAEKGTAENWIFRNTSSDKQSSEEVKNSSTNVTTNVSNASDKTPEVSDGNLVPQLTSSLNKNSSEDIENATIGETANSTNANKVNESNSGNVIPQNMSSLNKNPNEEIQKPLSNETQNIGNSTVLINKPNEVTEGNVTSLNKEPVEGILNTSISETNNATNLDVKPIQTSSENEIPQTNSSEKNVVLAAITPTHALSRAKKDLLDTNSIEDSKDPINNFNNLTPASRENSRLGRAETSSNQQLPRDDFPSSGKDFADEISLSSNAFTNKVLLNEYSSKQDFTPLDQKFTKPTLGCSWISYMINTNWRNTWKALPYHRGTPYFNIGYGWLDGKRGNPGVSYEKELECPVAVCRLPNSYDSRKYYRMCTSLQEPLDQGCYCRASWAVSAASALSDRFCISTNGALDLQLSGQNVLSCCEYCGGASGCEGGQALYAWLYFHDRGVPSGSQYGRRKGCQPYLIRPCKSQYNPSTPISTPQCSDKCQTSFYYNYRKPFLYKAARVYTLKNASIDAIKKEIYFRGPVTAEFKIYEDFQCYKSGIYNHVVGDFMGYKAIKLIGWGEERGVPYWIAANTWGSYWGEDGFFRVSMDSDGYNIANSISAGIPSLSEPLTMR